MRRRVVGEWLAIAACVVAAAAAGCARTPATGRAVSAPVAPAPAASVPAVPAPPPEVAPPPPTVTAPTLPPAPLIGPPPTPPSPPGPTVLKKDTPVAPPPRVLAPQVGGNEEARLSREVRTRLEGAEKAVGLIDQKRLGAPQLETYATIQSFLSKAREAVGARDYQRALTLADKAQTLATDLSRSTTR